MTKLIDRIFRSPWNISRWVRLIIGFLIGLSGLMDELWVVGLFGLFLVSQALYGVGCSQGSCETKSA